MKSNPHSMRRHTEWAVKDVQCISDCYVSPVRLVNPDYFARFNAWWDLSMAKGQFRGGLWNWCLTIEMAMQPCSVCIAVISFSNVKHHQVRSGICSWLSSDKQHARMGFNVVRFIHFLQCLSHCRWFKRVAEAIPLPLCCKRCAFLSCEVQASPLSSPLAAGVIKSALPIPGERDLIACLPPWAFHPPPSQGCFVQPSVPSPQSLLSEPSFQPEPQQPSCTHQPHAGALHGSSHVCVWNRIGFPLSLARRYSICCVGMQLAHTG